MKNMKKTISVLVAMSMVVGLTPAPKADAAKKVSLSSKSITLKVKKTKTLKLKKGSKAITKGVKWSSSDSKVASVTSKGKVTAKKAGKATITAKYQKKSYKCKVTVKGDSNSSTNTKQTEVPTATAPITMVPATTASTTAIATQTPGTSNTPSGSPSSSASAAPGQTSGTAASTTPAANQGTNAPGATIAPQNTSAPVAPEATADVSEQESTGEASTNSFFKENVSIDYGTISKYVEFDVKTSGGALDPVEVEELTELGFTIDEERGIAYKDQLCESVTYTFKKLPTTLEDIESFFEEPEATIESEEYGCTLNYGGFNAMAANICAACTFKGGSNPADPFFDNDPVRDMFELINGPATSMNIAKSEMDTAISSMKSAIQSCGENVYKSYFNGATPYNNYEPSEPYVLEMYKGPYYIEQKETITGTRPTTYMILVQSGGEDSERYIDVYYSTRNERWYSYENQFMHVTANNFNTPEEEL